MEAAKPIQIETPIPSVENTKINFIEELLIKKKNIKFNLE